VRRVPQRCFQLGNPSYNSQEWFLPIVATSDLTGQIGQLAERLIQPHPDRCNAVEGVTEVRAVHSERLVNDVAHLAL